MIDGMPTYNLYIGGQWARASRNEATTSVVKAADPKEALRIANDTDYGLSAAVITNAMQRALDFSLRLESGMVHVKDTTISDEPHVPFGGVKNSGFGREGGRYSLEELTEVKWVTIQMGKRQFPF